LTPGRYYVRAWTFRYVQSALDGSTFQEYSFDVTPQEWAGDVTLPIDLRLSSWVNKTVHFHNMPGTLTTDGISTGANWLVGGLWDANGNMFAWNTTYLPVPESVINLKDATTFPSASYPYVDSSGNLQYGLGNAAGDVGTWIDPARTNQFCNDPYILASDGVTLITNPQYGNCNIQFWGFNDTWVGQNYGIPSGTYQPKVYALGYLQQTTDYVSVTLSGTPTSISDHLYRGVGFNFSAYSIDWERPRVNRNWVYPGTDIEVAILDSQGNFLSEVCQGCDGVGSGEFYDPYAGGGQPRTAGADKYNLIQTGDNYTVQMDGGGRNVLPSDNAQEAFFGLDASYALVGGYWSRTGGVNSGFTTKNSWSAWKATFYTPTAFDSGQYSFRGWTYGYIQNKDFTVYALKGQVADIKVNLVIGVNVTVDILFKKEHVISPTTANMQARVRLFNDQGQLVAEWMTSEGTYVTGNGRAAAADTPTGTATQPYEWLGGYNYLPGGVSLLHVELHGLPAFFGTFGDNIFTPYHGDFEVDMWGDVTHFPNAGILGYPDYQGGWTAEVDFVNIYNNNTSIANVIGAPSTDPNAVNNWYPPVAGLLMGESFHIIPGTTATSGISYTEDGALDSFFVGHTMAPNHLGPYSQQGVWQISNAHNSGEASGIFEVDLNGYITGQALAFTWSTEFRSISWYTAQVVSADGRSTFNFYTSDGIYEGFLTPGTYSLTLAGPGVTSQTLSLAVSAGMSSAPGSGANLYLEQSNVPVPEFSGLAIAAFSALAASLYVLRRRRK